MVHIELLVSTMEIAGLAKKKKPKVRKRTNREVAILLTAGALVPVRLWPMERLKVILS